MKIPQKSSVKKSASSKAKENAKKSVIGNELLAIVKQNRLMVKSKLEQKFRATTLFNFMQRKRKRGRPRKDKLTSAISHQAGMQKQEAIWSLAYPTTNLSNVKEVAVMSSRKSIQTNIGETLLSTQVTTTTTTTLENIPVKKGMQEQPTVATKRKHIDYSVNPEIASALEEAVHQT